jgi:dihydroorotase
MKSYLFRHIAIVDPGSPHNGQTTDILIENGTISRIAKKQALPIGATEVDASGWQALPGFCDLMVDFGDPGHEYREDIRTGMAVAAAGGFTAVCTMAATHPVVQEKSNIEYIINKAGNGPVEVWPLGAVTENMEGKNPTEMIDMHQAGAVAFSDAPHTISDSGVMLRAMQYAQPLKSVIMSIPYDKSLCNEGQVNEGVVSVKMGFRGMPAMAEALAVHRDIELARYAGTGLHLCGISTAESVQLVKEAKKAGVQITATVFLHHLLLSENEVAGFDTNYKVFPPLRTEKDRKALVKAVIDGTIDTISTQHTPLDTEAKDLEFEYALPGIIGLETAYALLKTRLGDQIGDELLVRLLSQQPRQVLHKLPAHIAEGAVANISLVNPSTNWTYSRGKSRSKNSPFLGQELTGKVMGIVNRGQVVLF